MTEQLDVFLGQETAPFLAKLFQVIETEEYLNPSAINIAAVATAAATTLAEPSTAIASESQTESTLINQIIEAVSKVDRECTPPLTTVTETKHKDLLAEPLVANASPIVSPVVSPLCKSQESSPSKQQQLQDNYVRETHRRSSLRSRSRSRSRSFEKVVRSRSRDRRFSNREKMGRQQYRNKSPPMDRRRYDRRNDRSPKFGAGAGRPMAHSLSKSRSRSPERRKISRSISPSADDVAPKPKRQRCRDFDGKIKNIIFYFKTNNKCFFFVLEKGYCMRGETCPWDHGVDPVVLEDINNPALISIQANPHMRGGEYSPDAPELWNRGGNFGGQRGGGPSHRGGPPGIYPRLPGSGFRGGPPFSFPVNPSATTPLQRELISVPVVDGNSGGDISAQGAKRRYEPEDTVAIAEGPAKRKIPINSRLGPRVGLQQNCSLELRKVPRGLNSIAHLNNHFSKFGKIVNIQISYDGDPEAAIITFSTHAEANVAYRSTEAVLNNRFIKVFWHTGGGGGGSNAAAGNGTGDNHVTAKEDNPMPMGRKQNQYSLTNINNTVPAVPTATATDAPKTTTIVSQVSSTGTLTTSTGAATGTTTTTTTAGTTVASTSSSSSSNIQSAASLLRARNNRVNRAATEIIRKKQEDQVKAAVQLAHGLHKRRHELLQEYLKQMRTMLELVEKLDINDPQRINALTTIKELQGSIDKLKKEIASDQAQMTAQMQPQQPVRKSKEQQKKELLDIELELIAQQQEGNDTSAIQKRIEELQKSLGATPSKQHFISRSTRVRPAPPGSTSVDRRPTTLLIQGFAIEDSDALLGHFKVNIFILFLFVFFHEF